MNDHSTPRKLSLPVVPVSFLALVIIGALLYGWLRPPGEGVAPRPEGTVGVGRLEPFRTPGGALHTNGFVKTEELRREDGSWRGTTSSAIRLDATYRYRIELRARWNYYIDDVRRTALVVAPPFTPELPVAVDSRTVQEWTSSGWGRFDKWDQLQALRQEISPYLAGKASSKAYMDIARGELVLAGVVWWLPGPPVPSPASLALPGTGAQPVGQVANLPEASGRLATCPTENTTPGPADGSQP